MEKPKKGRKGSQNPALSPYNITSKWKIDRRGWSLKLVGIRRGSRLNSKQASPRTWDSRARALWPPWAQCPLAPSSTASCHRRSPWLDPRDHGSRPTTPRTSGGSRRGPPTRPRWGPAWWSILRTGMGSASSTWGSPRPRQRWRSSSLTKVGAANGLPLCEERERGRSSRSCFALSSLSFGFWFFVGATWSGCVVLCCVVLCCACLYLYLGTRDINRESPWTTSRACSGHFGKNINGKDAQCLLD